MGDKIFSDKRVLINTLSLCYNTMSSNTKAWEAELKQDASYTHEYDVVHTLKTYKPTAPHSGQG
jgi:hypothetical protein